MDDSTIVDLYLQRDEAAIQVTTEKYGHRLRSLAYGFVENLQTAEECENDTYLEAWKSIPPHEPRGYLYPFLARITRHIALDFCRSRTRLKRNAYLCELTTEMEQCIPAPDDNLCRLEEAELAAAINSFLATLGAEERNIFLRRYWFLDSIPSIAFRFGCSESKVKSRLYRSRNRLRVYLIKEGYDL